MKMKNQKGFATLAVTVLLLFLITFNVFLGSKGAVLEQKSANNVYKSEVAFENAEMGSRILLQQLQAAANVVANDFTKCVAGSATAPSFCRVTANTDSVNLAYFASYDSTTKTITSTGYVSGGAMGSAPGASARTVTQRILYAAGTMGALGAPVTSALTTLGNVTLGGNTTIGSITAGGTVSTSGSSSVGSQTTNSSTFQMALLDHNNNVLLDASGNPVTRSLTSDEYFMYFFGNLCPVAKAAGNAANCKAEAPTTVANMSNGYVCTSACTLVDLKAQYAAGKNVMLLEQDGMRINSNIVLGTVTQPVLILVMNGGSVSINGNAKIYGVVYVDVVDAVTAVNCSCNASDTAATITQAPVMGDDTTKPIYGNDTTKPIGYSTSVSSTQCVKNGQDYSSSAKSCVTVLKDSYGNTLSPSITTAVGGYLPKWTSDTGFAQKITGYQQKIVGYKTTGATWGSTSYGLNANQAPACTVNACSSSASVCKPSDTVSASTSVGSTSMCSFAASAVSGSNNTPVTINVLGTWDNSGGGNALIQGAAITSGNFSGTGGIALVQNSTSVTALQNSPSICAPAPNGWSDMH